MGLNTLEVIGLQHFKKDQIFIPHILNVVGVGTGKIAYIPSAVVKL
jgi:hypothetical protein